MTFALVLIVEPAVEVRATLLKDTAAFVPLTLGPEPIVRVLLPIVSPPRLCIIPVEVGVAWSLRMVALPPTVTL